MPTAEVDGVQVDSQTGTVEELTAALTSGSGAGAGGDAADKGPAASASAPAVPSEPTSDPDPASEAGKQLAGKRKSMQDRIDQVTWEKHEAARRAEKAEQELAALKTPQTAKSADDGKPRLKAFTDRIGAEGGFEDYESAVEAHAEALTDYKLSARDAASATNHQQTARAAALHQTETRGQEAHADFDAVLGSFVQSGGRFAPTSVAEAQGPLGDLEAVILQHPKGHSVAYEVAKDPELYRKLLASPSRVMFMAEMGTLLTRLEGAPAGSPAKPAPVSKAHAPVQPVVGAPKATNGPPGDDATDEEYRQWANAQDLAARRRR